LFGGGGWYNNGGIKLLASSSHDSTVKPLYTVSLGIRQTIWLRGGFRFSGVIYRVVNRPLAMFSIEGFWLKVVSLY